LVLLSAGVIARADDQKESDVQKERQQAIRRLSLDITGREPTEQELKDLAGDGSADAYRKAVEQFYSEQQNKRVRLDIEKQARELQDAERAIVLTYKAADEAHAPKTYMGIGVEAPNETLRAQLKLPEGLGLVVNYVDPNGPSKELIHLHDVLEKLDDQLLINGEQFATLVRMHKQGDSVSISVIREARHIQVTIRLGEKETSSANSTNIDLAAAFDSRVANINSDLTAALDSRVANVNTIASSNNLWNAAKLAPISTSVSDNLFSFARTGPVTFDDGTIVAVLQRAGDQSVLSAFDRGSGKILFTGPVNNDQQWNSVPDDLRQKLATWRGLTGPGFLPVYGLTVYGNGTMTTGPNGYTITGDRVELQTHPTTQPTDKK